MIRIVIADPHQLYRETLAGMLNAEPNICVIAICSVNSLVPCMIRGLQPDIVLIDPAVKNNSEAAFIQKIRDVAAAKIICLSMHCNPAYAIKMCRYGADGFVSKDAPIKEFAIAIKEVLAGNQYICEETMAQLSVSDISTVLGAANYQPVKRPQPAIVKKTKEMGWLFQLFHQTQHTQSSCVPLTGAGSL
jgi:two-component system invasion response regulator UvrY